MPKAAGIYGQGAENERSVGGKLLKSDWGGAGGILAKLTQQDFH